MSFAPKEQDFLSAVFAKQEDIVSRDIAGEAVLVPIRGRLADLQRFFSLNPIAAEIWRCLDGVRNVRAVRDAIVASFEVDEAHAQTDLHDFLQQMLHAGLVTEVR